jgi:hypothetical protein
MQGSMFIVHENGTWMETVQLKFLNKDGKFMNDFTKFLKYYTYTR